MKISYILSCLIAFLFSGVLPSVAAQTASMANVCPGGLFCTANGQYFCDPGHCDISPYTRAPATLITPGWGEMSDEGLCDTCYKKDGTRYSGCRYCADDYDEAWIDWFGFYFIKNGEAMYHSFSANPHTSGIFACPGTYPSSENGASSVFECYRVTAGGQKEYYKPSKNMQTGSSRNSNIDIGTVNALVKDLQSALSKAQDLQDALNKANQETKNNKTDNAKALINAGVTEKVKKSEPVKSTRSSSTRSSNSELDAAKAMISAGM